MQKANETLPELSRTLKAGPNGLGSKASQKPTHDPNETTKAVAEFWGIMAVDYPYSWPDRMGAVGGKLFKLWLAELQQFSAAQVQVATNLFRQQGKDFPPNRNVFVRLCREGDSVKASEVMVHITNWCRNKVWLSDLAYSAAKILGLSHVKRMTEFELAQCLPGAIEAARKLGIKSPPALAPVGPQKQLDVKPKNLEVGKAAIAELKQSLSDKFRMQEKARLRRESGKCQRRNCDEDLPPGWQAVWCPTCAAPQNEENHIGESNNVRS